MTRNAPTTSIVKEISISARVEKIYAVLTDPKQLVQWWGDGVDRWESDLRAGGRWASYGTFSDGSNYCVKGNYRIVQPPRVVEMNCKHWGEDAEETVIRYELMGTQGETHLRVIHSGFINTQFRDDHSAGWDQALARMVAFVAGAPN